MLLLTTLLAVQFVMAQPGARLKLSSNYPSAGEKITMTYDTAGTVTGGKKDLEASVFFLDNKDYPVADIDLKPTANIFRGEFAIPANASAFFIKITAGDSVDNNSGKGYVYMVYKDKQPVAGAYAMKAYFLAGMGNYYARITPDPKQGMELYDKEFEQHPETKKDYQRGYYLLIATKPEYRKEVFEGIKRLEKSDDEKELILAAYLMDMTKENSGDSLNTVIRAKFPNGLTVKKDLLASFNKEYDAEKKDSVFRVYSQKYPEVKGDKSTSFEYFKSALAAAYLLKDDLDKYYGYESQLTDKVSIAEAANDRAYYWAQHNQRLNDAEKLAKESLDILSEAIKNPVSAPYTSPLQVKKRYLIDYQWLANDYAFILAKQNKFAEALKYEQPVIDRLKYIDGDIYENYVHILVESGEYAKAKEYAEKAIMNGHNSELIVSDLKRSFIKLNGSDKGLEQYIAPLQAAAYKKQIGMVAQTMINKPAPDFALKDIDGNTVSLASLKGKVVIVDFWATWCGPCKGSFPGMQLAVTKYKDNPDVKFLFVDTRETLENYTEEVKKFLADNKYTFHVIFDEKNADGKQRKVLDSYEVSGIPTKFIIDKNGTIRFKEVGYAPEITPTELADDIGMMITIASNPEAYASTAK